MKLLETMRIKNGRAINLPWHQRRVDAACRRYRFRPLDLVRLKHPATPLTRCRITYAESIESIEYPPIGIRLIRTLKPVNAAPKYPFKYADRTALNLLLNTRGKADEILIIKNGLITDTSVGNVAFFDGTRWLTPRAPLLKGTLRARLVASGFLKPATLSLTKLDRFWLVAVMNAVTGFYIAGRVENVILEQA